MKTEAYFISHCDCEHCDLGVFQYTCPECKKDKLDYNIWWDKDDLYNGMIKPFHCEDCDTKLIVSWNQEEYEFQVEIDV